MDSVDVWTQKAISMKFVGVLLFVTGLVSITIEKLHYGHSNPVDEFLKQILELLKILMPSGIPELDIPPLDPFEVPAFDDIHIEYA